MRAWVVCLGLIPFGCGSSGDDGGSAGKAGSDAATGGSGGGFVDGGSWLDSSFGGSTNEAGASCNDGAQNGGETGEDCGGPCAPCGLGVGCDGPEDCLSFLCMEGQCCTSSTYDVTTGLVSGTGDVCCNGTDTRLSIEDCGVGDAHFADPVEPNCAHASEGAMNGGSCCAKITCQTANCGG